MLKIDYDSRNNIFTATYCNDVIDSPSINMCITDGENQNISPAEKCLLFWRFRFGHWNICDTQIILWLPPFGTDKFFSSIRITFEQLTKCEVFQYAKAKHKDPHGKKTQIYITHEGSFHDNYLRPGSGVSVDHVESWLKGRAYNFFGIITYEHSLGEFIFVDNMIGYINVEHQLGFSS